MDVYEHMPYIHGCGPYCVNFYEVKKLRGEHDLYTRLYRVVYGHVSWNWEFYKNLWDEHRLCTRSYKDYTAYVDGRAQLFPYFPDLCNVLLCQIRQL